MRIGLVLGKFLPLHKGHLKLIDFAREHCDRLIVLLCHHSSEKISETQRLSWLRLCLGGYTNIQIQSFHYSAEQLPDTSVYSEESATAWATILKQQFPDVNILFTSEEYGEPVTRLMDIQHSMYDQARDITPVSASLINKYPFEYWDYLPKPVQPFFVKKVCIAGSESTGKSTLTKRLADFFNTSYVPEMAREVISHTEECTYEHLLEIAALQATTIDIKIAEANKILFCDTDLNITKSYSNFLFDKSLIVPHWIEEANVFDLYLFLDVDCQYIQDGTRLDEFQRNRLSRFHKKQFDSCSINYTIINGSWDERFIKSCEIVEKNFFS